MDDRPRVAEDRWSRRRWGVASLFLLGWLSSRLANAASTSPAFEKPLYLVFVWLVSIASLALAVNRFQNPEQRTKSFQYLIKATVRAFRTNGDYQPGFDLDEVRSGSPPTRHPVWRSLGAFIAFCVALPVRVVTFALIVRDSECSQTSLMTFIPAALVSIDALVAWRQQWRTVGLGTDERTQPNSGTVLVVVACWIYGFGTWVLQTASAGPDTTYICPSAELVAGLVPALQHIGVVADIVGLHALLTLMRDSDTNEKRPSSPLFLYLLSLPCIVCAVQILIFGICWYILVKEDREWMLAIPFRLVWGVIKLDVLLCATAVVFAGVIVRFDYVAALLVSFSSIVLSITFEEPHFLPPQSPIKSFVGYALACGGVWLFIETSLSSRETQDPIKSTAGSRKSSHRISLIMTILVTLLGCAVLWSRNVYLEIHPIESLISSAKIRHEAWAKQAKSSSNLGEAYKEYGRRYNRYPPPGFDKWYQFAVDRKSEVIDDFDGLMADLAVFEHLDPEVLRRRTWQAMTDQIDGISGISIRNGKANMSDNTIPTHRWMMEGVLSMISKFEEHLPDMDLGFNINDESRVLGDTNTLTHIPYPRGPPIYPKQPMYTSFSPQRGQYWDAAATYNENGPPVFEERSFTNVFNEFGVGTCSSSASYEFRWDASRFCSSCVASHSDGLIFNNWTASTDICQQPDLIRQHGFYSSPSSFRGSHILFPVFSQSKAPYYADIRYPSAWNYQKKAMYAPTDEHPDSDWDTKKKQLYWRGSPTEGYALHNDWRGFTRQRIVNMASTPSQNHQILLPAPASSSSSSHSQQHQPRSRWRYLSLPSPQLQSLLSPDLRFTSILPRCGHKDCDDQIAHFSPLAEQSDFQAHWANAYLLDLDGAGFSGRFLPFLKSKCLPFKAALFREWYDDRVVPWRHFVPLDLRGQGLWSTLVYFSGWRGKNLGATMEGRDEEAKEIADEGRSWALKTLRPEDMEIYMFRLLLEWGRLTDDRRDEIGFVM